MLTKSPWPGTESCHPRNRGRIGRGCSFACSRVQQRPSMNKFELPTVAGPGVPEHRAADVAACLAALEKSISGEVRCDRLSRAIYSTDASVYQIVPAGVVLPKSHADVREAVNTCSAFGVPITARGGGTSQAGQAIGPGIVLDRSEEHTSELQSLRHLVCRLLLE